MNAAQQERLAELGRIYRLDVVYVFGSRAREVAGLPDHAGEGAPDEQGWAGLGGEADDHPGPPASDVDIGVQPERGTHLTARDRVRLTLGLEELLSAPRVDLVILPEADPFLAAEVVRGELLYARDLDQEAEIQLYYLRRAGDLAPFFRERWRTLMGSEL
jgi:uncharacterized protein